jgi:hypothetical protein
VSTSSQSSRDRHRRPFSLAAYALEVDETISASVII